MNVNISVENADLVDAAKDIAKASSTISSLNGSVQEEKVANALHTATTMFQSNVQCLSHILALRKAEQEMAADHAQVIEEMQEDFAKEIMKREINMEEAEVSVERMRKEMATMKEELALQGVWASLLTPESFPLPEVVTDEQGNKRLGFSPSSSSTAKEEEVSKQKSSLAAALRMISSQVAKDVITQSACDEKGERIRSRQESFTTKLLEAVWWLQGRVDGEVTAKEQEIENLMAQLKKAKEGEAAARQAARETEVAAALALERQGMQLEDAQVQLMRAIAAGGLPSSSFVARTIPSSPFTQPQDEERVAASPDYFMGHDATLIEGSDIKTTKHPRVHFEAAVSEIKAGRGGDEADKENRSPNFAYTGATGTASAQRRLRQARSPAAQSSFRSPSFDYSHQPHLYTRNRTPSSSSPAARAMGMGRSQVPSSSLTNASHVSALSTGLTRVSASTGSTAAIYSASKATATATRVAWEGQLQQDPLRRENDHALHRPRRSFIISSKSPIDTTRLDTTTAPTALNTSRSPSSSQDSEREASLHVHHQSVKQVMSYGALIASQEPEPTSVYRDKQHGPFKAATDTGALFHSRYLARERGEE